MRLVGPRANDLLMDCCLWNAMEHVQLCWDSYASVPEWIGM